MRFVSFNLSIQTTMLLRPLKTSHLGGLYSQVPHYLRALLKHIIPCCRLLTGSNSYVKLKYLHKTIASILFGFNSLCAILTNGLSFSFCVLSSSPNAVRAITSIAKFAKCLKHRIALFYKIKLNYFIIST